MQPVFSIDGKFINVAYTLKNTGSTDATVSVGSHADIQIGNDDSAPITKFDDGRGFRMVNRYNSNLQFNFFGKGTIGVTDVDTFWFGSYSDRRDDVFTQVEADSYSGDSGMAYSWVNRVIPAGETRVFRTTMGTSDAASGTNVPIGVNFDTQGGSEVAPIAVSSAGSTISAPAAPTRSGYQFDGWYTEPECVTRFDFSTPITATITLYAKWTQNADTTYTITFDTNGGTCGTSTMTTGADGKLASLPTPTRSGSYRFVGWYTAASGGTKVTTSTVFTANTTVYAHWTYTGGGGGGYTPPTYPPIVEQPKEGGSVSVSPSNPKQRDTVIITPKPDEGYEVDTITVTDRNGNPVTVTAELDGTYSFIQPNSKVKIEVTYKLTETPWRNPFTDISMGDWYYDAVLWAAENGITNGTSATTFSPNASCIRAQMATFLWNAAGKPEPESATSPFIDVTDPGAYYYKAVLWAKENGIAFGVGDHIFAPDAPCTRSQMTAFLFRFADGNKVSIANPFTDVKEGVWYYDSVMWAVFEGVTTGTSATTFAPESVCDRAQMVTFLYRLLGK